jgi:heme-degrading monooxygenase HmoA
MAIRMTNTAPVMSGEDYDRMMVDVAEPLRRADGFISHSAEASADGLTVTELWESRAQWQKWFDASVRPHLPPDAAEPTITELHSAFGHRPPAND